MKSQLFINIDRVTNILYNEKTQKINLTERRYGLSSKSWRKHI